MCLDGCFTLQWFGGKTRFSVVCQSILKCGGGHPEFFDITVFTKFYNNFLLLRVYYALTSKFVAKRRVLLRNSVEIVTVVDDTK